MLTKRWTPIVLGLMLVSLLPGCKSMLSVPTMERDRTIVIDGNEAEWTDALYPVADENLAFATRYDDTHL